MIASPLLPDSSAESACGVQDGIASFGAGSMLLSWLGVPAGQNDRLRPALCNGLITALRVISAIAANACDDLVIGALAEQARQHRRIAGGVVGHLDGPDFQRRRINT